MNDQGSIDRSGLPPSWRMALWGGIAALLMIPAIAMHFTREVNWGPGDFVAATGLLSAAGLGLEWAARAAFSRGGRLLLAGAIVFALLVVWVELAVGIFD